MTNRHTYDRIMAIMKVAVFAGMGEGTPKMRADAVEIGRILGKNGHTMVQGGYAHGMMGESLKEFQKYSDDVEVVTPKVYAHEMEGMKYNKLYVVDTLGERINKFMEVSDFAIALPGGMGTFHEILCAAEMYKAKESRTVDIAVVNTDGYFNGLKEQIETAKKMGFIPKDRFDVKFFDSAKALEFHVDALSVLGKEK